MTFGNNMYSIISKRWNGGLNLKKNNLNKLLIIAAFLLIFAFVAINDTSIFNKIKTQIYSKDLSTVEYNWYFNPREDGKQPSPIKEATFFKNYNSYYVGDPKEKVIYLTFDSGYENGYTNNILDVLKKHNAPGNFFVVESYIKNNPEIIKRMEKEGRPLNDDETKEYWFYSSKVDEITKIILEMMSKEHSQNT